MWAAVPAAAACDAVGDDDDVPLGPGQLPPRNAHLPPLHAEINISIIMIKGQLELEVCFHSSIMLLSEKLAHFPLQNFLLTFILSSR